MQILWPRTLNSLIRAVFFQFVTLLAFISIQTFDPWHPLSWVMNDIGLLITPTSWFFDLMAILTVVGIGILYSHQMSLYPWIPKNQLSNLTRLFQPEILMSFAAHFFAGGILMRTYLGLLGGKFNSLTSICEAEKCLNVPHIFLVMSASFMTLTVWKDFHFGNVNLITFPMIPLTGNARLSRQMSGLIRNSLVNVELNMRWFYALYFVLGHRLVNVLSELSRLEPSATSYFITTSLWSHLELHFQCLILNSLLTFTLGLLREIIGINFTKRFNFDVTGEHGLIKSLTAAPNQDLLNHLAYYEFSMIANDNLAKRSEFYSLSQPGGHPHTWNALTNACLTRIETFAKHLNDSVQPPAATAIAPKAGHQEKQVPVLYSASKSRPLAGPKDDQKKPNNMNDQSSKKKILESVLSKMALNSYPVKILKAIKDKFSNNALFASAPDAGTRAVFAQSQIIIWAVEGILCLFYFLSSCRQESEHEFFKTFIITFFRSVLLDLIFYPRGPLWSRAKRFT